MKKNLTFIFTVAVTAALFMLAACNGTNNPPTGGGGTEDTTGKGDPVNPPVDPGEGEELPAQWTKLHKEIQNRWDEVTTILPVPACGIGEFGQRQWFAGQGTWPSGNCAVTWHVPGNLEGYEKQLEKAGFQLKVNGGNNWYANKDLYILIDDTDQIFYIYRALDRKNG